MRIAASQSCGGVEELAALQNADDNCRGCPRCPRSVLKRFFLVLIVVKWTKDLSITTAFITGTVAAQQFRGARPVCSLSEINATNLQSPISGNLSFEVVSDALILDPLVNGITALPFCSKNITDVNGTFYHRPDTRFETIERKFASDMYIVYTDSVHSFHVSMQVNITAISERIDPTSLQGTVSCRMRFFVCDALEIGTCSPLLRSLLHANTSFEVQAESQSWSTNPQTGEFRASVAENWTLNHVEGSGTDFVASDEFVSSVHYVNWSLVELDQTPHYETYRAAVNFTLDVPLNSLYGAYFIVSDAVLDFPTKDETIKRVDIAMAMPENALYVTTPPNIQEVTQAFIVFLSVMIFVFGVFALGCLLFIISKRNDPIMLLAQAPFLVILNAACFFQTAFTFTYLPLRDSFCRMMGPLVLVPITLEAAILVARLWRVNKTIGTANFIGRHSEKQALEQSQMPCGCNLGILVIDGLSFLAKLPLRCCSKEKTTHKVSRRSIRQTATARETASLIVVLTLPQLILQVFGSIYYTSKLEMQFDEDADAGRIVCSNNGAWVANAGIGLSSLMYFIAVGVAWISRMLPSTFNETTQVFRAAGIVSLLSVVSIPLMVRSDVPAQSPDIVVFFRSLLSIGTSVTILSVLIMPKILRVFSGEKVVISTLLGSPIHPSTGMSTEDGNLASTGPSEQSQAGRVNGRDSDKSQAVQRIVLRQNDPIPTSIAQQAISVEGVLHHVTERSFDGRPLTSENWDLMREEVNKLQAELDRYELEGRGGRRRVSWAE